MTRFYGFGVVKIGKKSLRFAKNEERYKPGFLETDEQGLINELKRRGYDFTDLTPPKAETPKSEAHKSKGKINEDSKNK